MRTLADDLREALDPCVTFERAFGVEPMAHQREYLRETRPVVVLKPRQAGYSTAAAALAIHEALYWPNTTGAVVSPSMRQSQEVALRARAGLVRMGIRLEQDASSVIGLPNGSRIVSLPGSARAVRGWTCQRILVLDECGFIDQATIAAARAVVATGGRLVMQSTPAMASGSFYDAWQGEDMVHLTVDVRDVTTISEAFLESERAALGDDVWAMEYGREFGRGDMGRSLFDPARLAELGLVVDDGEAVHEAARAPERPREDHRVRSL